MHLQEKKLSFPKKCQQLDLILFRLDSLLKKNNKTKQNPPIFKSTQGI